MVPAPGQSTLRELYRVHSLTRRNDGNMVELYLMTDCHESLTREVEWEDDHSLDRRAFEAHWNHECLEARPQKMIWLLCYFPPRSWVVMGARVGQGPKGIVL